MPVPKAAVHKNNRPVFWQDNIWFAGKVLLMDAEAISKFKESFPQTDLRESIDSSNSRHYSTSLSF
jgi:hypothetical protein